MSMTALLDRHALHVSALSFLLISSVFDFTFKQALPHGFVTQVRASIACAIPLGI